MSFMNYKYIPSMKWLLEITKNGTDIFSITVYDIKTRAEIDCFVIKPDFNISLEAALHHELVALIEAEGERVKEFSAETIALSALDFETALAEINTLT